MADLVLLSKHEWCGFFFNSGFPQRSRGLQKAQYTPGLPYDHEIKLPLLSSPYLSLGHFFLREAFLYKLAGERGVVEPNKGDSKKGVGVNQYFHLEP
jgi:hypothetical protein